MIPANVQEILINWAPVLFILGAWAFLLVRMRRGPYSQYQKDSFELKRRQTEALERIAAAIEKR